jgi:hypothetical protein
MVFPDSNLKKSKFLILWEDQAGFQFEWKENTNDIIETEEYLKSHFGATIHFAGEIAILKDLTNIEK